MSFSSDLREELIELKMWDNNSSLKQDEQLSRLLIREAFIKYDKQVELDGADECVEKKILSSNHLNVYMLWMIALLSLIM